jgi:hypothetical protein
VKPRLLVIAVASRLPGWAEAACVEYLKRMPRGFETSRVAVKPESRAGTKSPGRILAAEAERILAATPAGAQLVALDERGKDLTTARTAWIRRCAPAARSRCAFRRSPCRTRSRKCCFASSCIAPRRSSPATRITGSSVPRG